MARKAPKTEPLSEEEKLRREFCQEFLADWRADAPFRKGCREDNDFYDGNQWDPEDLRVLAERGQPAVTINRIKPKCDALFGMQQAMRVDTKAYPAGERETEAHDLSEFFRSVEDDNDFDDSESLAFEDIVVPGRSWYRMGKRWDGLKSRHFVKRAYLEDIVPDRKSREVDHSDAKRLHETVWMDLEDAKKLFPDYADKLAHSADERALESGTDSEMVRKRPDQYAGDGYGGSLSRDDLHEFANSKSRQVRIVKTWYRTLEPRKYYYQSQQPEGPTDVTDFGPKELQTLRAAYPDGEVITQVEKKLHCLVYTWNCILEHKKDVRAYDKEAKFPLIMMEGYRERNSGVNYGLVRQMKDPQREVNKRRSKALHLISVNRTVYETGAFKNPQEALDEVSKPDAKIELMPGNFQKFQIQNNLDMSQAHFLLLQQAVQEIDAAGVSRELEGGKSQATSGRDYQLRQQQAVQGIRKLVSNLRSGRRRVALYLLDEWNEENPDRKISKYDVVVEEAPDTLNLQQETFDKLASFAEKGLLPPEFLDLLLEVSTMEPAMKKKFLDRLQAVRQAQMQAAQAQAGIPPAGPGVQ